MKTPQQNDHKHFIYSLLLHICILSVLMISFEFSQPMPVLRNSPHPDEIINAQIMDAPPELTKTIQKPLPTPKLEKPPEPTPVVKQMIKPIVDPDTIKIADEKKRQEKDRIQKQLLADLKKQTDQKKKQKQKALENAFQKEIQEMKAAALQQQMLQEQKRIAKTRQAEMSGVVDKYKALILQAISQHWLIPPNVNKKLSAHLLIRLAPGGMVLDVQLTKSSGDEALDRSARSAVFKASPLPVPTEAEAFDTFRQFALKVKPEYVLGNS